VLPGYSRAKPISKPRYCLGHLKRENHGKMVV
jgi:hypothetical protein